VSEVNALAKLGLASRSELESLKAEVAKLEQSVRRFESKSEDSAPLEVSRSGIRFIRDLDAEPESFQLALRQAMQSMGEDDLQLRKQA
jgi:hypothetical protein